MPNWLANWFERHQHPVSLILHFIGIPLTLWAVALAILQLTASQWDLWWRPTVLFILGYTFQWIGHKIEGNDMGEFVAIKKWLGRDYVAVSPRYAAKAVRTDMRTTESSYQNNKNSTRASQKRNKDETG